MYFSYVCLGVALERSSFKAIPCIYKERLWASISPNFRTTLLELLQLVLFLTRVLYEFTMDHVHHRIDRRLGHAWHGARPEQWMMGFVEFLLRLLLPALRALTTVPVPTPRAALTLALVCRAVFEILGRRDLKVIVVRVRIVPCSTPGGHVYEMRRARFFAAARRVGRGDRGSGGFPKEVFSVSRPRIDRVLFPTVHHGKRSFDGPVVVVVISACTLPTESDGAGTPGGADEADAVLGEQVRDGPEFTGLALAPEDPRVKEPERA